MFRAMTSLSIRTITVAGLAVLALWYALLGGGAMLVETIPAIARYGPPMIAAGPIDLFGDPVRSLVALVILVTDVALLVVVRRARLRRTRSARPDPLTPDDRMWAAHTAWLDECAARRAHKGAAKAS
jgi:hypothetical protein